MTETMKMSDVGNPTIIRKLARWVFGFDASSISQEVMNLTKLSYLDAIGCAFASLSVKVVQDILQTVDDFGGKEECTIIGTGRRTSLLNAVLSNGTLIRALDFNDHLPIDPTDGVQLGGHPSDIMAVALSVGERQGNSGRDVLIATAMGYELFGRFQRWLPNDRPWDYITTLGLVAPAVAGRLMKLSEEELAHALALSMAHCLTLGAVRRGQLSASKFLASSIALETGVLATLFAARGVTGPLAVFEDERGLIRALMPDVNPSKLTDPIGSKHMIEGVTIKAYPAFDMAQAPIAAALKMRETLKVSLDEIEMIELTLNDHPLVRRQMADTERSHPTSKESADHSLHFLVAVALLDGEVTLRQFEGERWFDPAVCALMARTTIQADKTWNVRAPGGYPCRLRVIARGGTEEVVEVPYAVGHPYNRMSASGVQEKFERCVKDILGEGCKDAIVRIVMMLEALSSVDLLMKQLIVHRKIK